jgi:predicted enzyme related to lactoylglutathione lyase
MTTSAPSTRVDFGCFTTKAREEEAEHAKNPAGAVELGFTVPDIQKFHQDIVTKGVQFSMPPTKQGFGGLLAQFVDSEGGHCSVGTE